MRAQSHGHIQPRDGVRRPAKPVQGKSETVVAVGETRIEGDGFFQIGDGAVALARQGEHPPEHVMGEAVLVVHGDGVFAGREPSYVCLSPNFGRGRHGPDAWGRTFSRLKLSSFWGFGGECLSLVSQEVSLHQCTPMVPSEQLRT